jgi:hypothetical protein
MKSILVKTLLICLLFLGCLLVPQAARERLRTRPAT